MRAFGCAHRKFISLPLPGLVKVRTISYPSTEEIVLKPLESNHPHPNTTSIQASNTTLSDQGAAMIKVPFLASRQAAACLHSLSNCNDTIECCCCCCCCCQVSFDCVPGMEGAGAIAVAVVIGGADKRVTLQFAFVKVCGHSNATAALFPGLAQKKIKVATGMHSTCLEPSDELLLGTRRNRNSCKLWLTGQGIAERNRHGNQLGRHGYRA